MDEDPGPDFFERANRRLMKEKNLLEFNKKLIAEGKLKNLPLHYAFVTKEDII